jgi:hypothetical protein
MNLSPRRSLPLGFWLWIAFALPYGICETLFGNGRNGVPAPAALPLATANLALAVFLGGHDHRSPAGHRGLHQSPR